MHTGTNLQTSLQGLLDVSHHPINARIIQKWSMGIPSVGIRAGAIDIFAKNHGFCDFLISKIPSLKLFGYFSAPSNLKNPPGNYSNISHRSMAGTNLSRWFSFYFPFDRIYVIVPKEGSFFAFPKKEFQSSMVTIGFRDSAFSPVKVKLVIFSLQGSN